MRLRHICLEGALAGFALAALSTPCLGLSFTAAGKNREGGECFRKGDYDGALKKYSDAMTKAPEKPQLYFNIGDVLYRQSKFQEAGKLFGRSAASGDSPLRAKSWYNMGNAKFRAAGGQAGPGAEGGGTGALQEAAECYIKALEFDPADKDAKYNLEFVQRVMERQQDEREKQEQEKKDQEKKDQEKEQEKKDQEKKDQEKKEQEKKDQEKKDQEEKGQEKKEQEEKGREEEKKEQERKEDREKQEQPPEGARGGEEGERPEGDLTEQQARQLIESLQREERDPANFMAAGGTPVPKEPDKDW